MSWRRVNDDHVIAADERVRYSVIVNCYDPMDDAGTWDGVTVAELKERIAEDEWRELVEEVEVIDVRVTTDQPEAS